VRRLYFAVIGGFIGLLIYAGATGNFGIIPDLPFDLPFARHVRPPANVLAAPLLYPQMTGRVGITGNQLVARFERLKGRATWERSQDQRGWIMRYSLPLELTGGSTEGAARFDYLADASQAGITGPGLQVVGWAADGDTLNANEIMAILSSIAAAMYQDGELR
jgi:hypothetical protein